MEFITSKTLFFLAVFTMSACQGPQRDHDESESEEKPLTDDLESGDNHDADFVGIYTQGPDYQEFKSCSDWKIYNVAKKTELAEEYKKLGLENGEPMFVRIDGSAINVQVENPRLEIEGIVLAEKYRGQNDCSSFGDRTFVFRGNEPFWSLTMDGEYVTFNHFERDSVVFDFQSPTWQDSVWVLNTPKQDQKLTVYISEKECFDSMSGIRYDMTVRLKTAGESYQGCGRWQAHDKKPGS